MNDTEERAKLLRQLGWSEELISACLSGASGHLAVATPEIQQIVAAGATSGSVVLEVAEPAAWSGIRI